MFVQSVFSSFLKHPSLYRLALSPAPLRTVSTSTAFLSSDPSFKHILQTNNLPEDVKVKIEAEAKDMFKARTTDVFSVYRIGSRMGGMTMISEADWARREAFLELERRRKLGLPLVDPNLIPPERVKLPPKEELGPDFKIIL
ncbi:unnamed protein product [Taenia asiatica]|uniref:Cytochrome c oxidase assembly protein COX20, mitochondrial n=1 Tax=Taenia asiatica TaxID=60517 RepID=A0A0R3VTC4_TAEAS|nr:unnamed protein product [Taenia asiatica]